jgi:hypothetical protein
LRFTKDASRHHEDKWSIDLSRADLSHAELRLAKVAPEQLDQAQSLQGAIIPHRDGPLGLSQTAAEPKLG